MKIIVNNLHTGNSQTYEIARIYDFDQLAKDFGPHIHSIVGETSNIRKAADDVAEYLSNHHLDVEVLDPQDAEEIYNPNVEHFDVKPDQKPEQAIDLKDVLESYNEAEHVDIPEMHVLNASTHRWK